MNNLSLSPRHWFGVRLALAGVDLRRIQLLMGHARFSTTAERYLLYTEAQVQAVQIPELKTGATSAAGGGHSGATRLPERAENGRKAAKTERGKRAKKGPGKRT